MKIIPALLIAGTLIALPVIAQNAAPGGGGGIRILPAPVPPPELGGEVAPLPPPEPGLEVAPGFPGHEFMPPMPGRYTLLAAQIQQNGKPVPVVLRIDTQTGQVWKLKQVTHQIRVNGQPQAVTSLAFQMVKEPTLGNAAPAPGLPGAFPRGGALPGLPAPGAPTDPTTPNDGAGAGFVRPATGIVRPQPRPAPRPPQE